jgi:hypothetical protein
MPNAIDARVRILAVPASGFSEVVALVWLFGSGLGLFG